MIDDLRNLAIFATVAETGSFSAAGRRLRLATSGISQHVSKLEQRLGVTLLYRSTRSLSLTGEGRRLLEHAQRMVAAAEDGLNSIAEISNEPAGDLNITMPAFMADSLYQEAIWDFVRQHRAVTVTVNHEDTRVDVVAGGYDLALRLGTMSDSSLRSRRIGYFRRKLVAAPSYLARNGAIETIDDLKHCDFVSIQGLSDRMTLLHGGEEVSFTAEKGRVLVDSFAALRSAVRAGLGIYRMPSVVSQTDLKEGRLVEILPDWTLPDLGIYAVWPETNRCSSLTRRLVDRLAAVG